MAMIMVDNGHVALARSMFNETFHLAWGSLPSDYPRKWTVDEDPPLFTLETVSESITKGSQNGRDNVTNTPLWGVNTVTAMEGTNRVSNGAFTTNTNDWTGINCTLASIGGGQTGNCCHMTKGTGTPMFYQEITGLTIGHVYKLTFYGKGGTAGNEGFAFGIGTAFNAMNVATVNGSLTSSFSLFTTTFTATQTNLFLIFSFNQGNGTHFFDTVVMDRVISYAETTDWVEDLQNNGISWSPAGAEPLAGSIYSANYVYEKDLVDVTSLVYEVGRRLVTQKSYCYEDPNGFIVTNDKSWTLTDEPTRHVYLMFKFDASDAENSVIYQLGIILGTVMAGNVPPAKQYLIYPSEIQDFGTLFMIDDVKPIARNPYTREMFEYVITF